MNLAALEKRLAALEQAVGAVIWVLVSEWDVDLIEHLPRWTRETWEHCVAIQEEEARRRALVMQALHDLEQEALQDGHDHFSFRIYGSAAGRVRIASSLGSYELDVPCLPGRRCRCWKGEPQVFVYRSDDAPGRVHVPEYGAVKARALRLYGLKDTI